MNYLSEKIRITVRKRAFGCCEYCLLHEDTTFLVHEIDHIISLKHGGLDEILNLALACSFCNRFKGSDVGSIFQDDFIRFFNPRKDIWANHFKIEDALIQPLTPIGEVTAKILQFNNIDRIIERQILIEAKKYPMIIF
jgi:HNH endonuclease